MLIKVLPPCREKQSPPCVSSDDACSCQFREMTLEGADSAAINRELWKQVVNPDHAKSGAPHNVQISQRRTILELQVMPGSSERHVSGKRIHMEELTQRGRPKHKDCAVDEANP